MVMSAFHWLLIISYNLWRTFDNVGVGQKSKFCKYNIFVWSSSMMFLVVVVTIDLTDLIPWKPNFTHIDCWINSMIIYLFKLQKIHDIVFIFAAYSWTALIYFFGPIFILLIINIAFFIKTITRIIVQNRNNRRQLAQSVNQGHLRNIAKYVLLGVYSFEIFNINVFSALACSSGFS